MCLIAHAYFTSDEAIIGEGVRYLRIVAFSYILAAFTNVYLNIIRSIERVVIATVVYATSLSVNIFLNAIFIFGLLGAPALGAAGAAIGTLCARAVEVIIVIYYAWKKNDVVRIRIKDMLKRYKWLEKDFFVYAFPVLLNEFAWGAGHGSHLFHCGASGQRIRGGPLCSSGVQTALHGHSLWYLQCHGHHDRQGNRGKEGALARDYGNRFAKLSLLFGAAGGILILLISPFVCSMLKLTPLAKTTSRS